MEGWNEAACAAASWREGPDPASNIETKLSSLKDFAASTALKDWALREPPSCSAKTNVLSYLEGFLYEKMEESEIHNNEYKCYNSCRKWLSHQESKFSTKFSKR